MRAPAGALGAAGLVLTLALGACGGGSGGDASWSARADAICARAEQTIRSGSPPQDIGDLRRAMVRAGEEVRRATDEIRKLEVPGEQRSRVAPVLADLDAVDASVQRIADAADGGRKDVERAARRLRLDAIDFGAHAKAAGLKRCGLEKTGVAAADTALAPAFANRIARAHTTFLLAEGLIARRYDPTGAVPERARYWVALFELVDRVAGDIDGEVPTTAEAAVEDYHDAYFEMKDAADYLSSIAQGQEPITSERIGEGEGRRRVAAFKAAGFTLLERSGPAGRAALRTLRNFGEAAAREGESS